MKRFSIIISLIISVVFVQAQNEMDALRYSRLEFSGTARSASMSNAFGALGGDMSTLSTNPAGIGIYKNSEMVFSPGLNFGTTTSKFYGTNNDDIYLSGEITNFGIILVKDSYAEGIAKFQIGFAKNRIANFDNRISVTGFNNESTLVDYYQNIANGTASANLDPFGAGQLWNAFLIDNIIGSDTEYFNDMDSGVRQTKSVEYKGNMDEYVFSGGLNLKDKIYLGASLGIPTITYSEESKFTEEDTKLTNDIFSKMIRYEELTTNGTGVNMKFGAIVRPLNWLRIGVAYHTPTYYTMSDRWETRTIGVYDQSPEGDDGATTYEPEAQVGVNDDYNLLTPSRFIGSAAFVVGKIGLISLEYERVNYSNARLMNSTDFYQENENIRDLYTVANNLKAGAEVRLGSLSLRGGVAYFSNPFGTNVNDQSYLSYSGGVGIRSGSVFVDLAYVTRRYEDKYYIYDASWVDASENKYQQGQLILTAGLKF